MGKDTKDFKAQIMKPCLLLVGLTLEHHCLREEEYLKGKPLAKGGMVLLTSCSDSRSGLESYRYMF